ncbi:18914_t:CDS:2, partial [Gigaspora margarita]
ITRKWVRYGEPILEEFDAVLSSNVGFEGKIREIDSKKIDTQRSAIKVRYTVKRKDGGEYSVSQSEAVWLRWKDPEISNGTIADELPGATTDEPPGVTTAVSRNRKHKSVGRN